jgi:hypothetical protein
MVVVQMNESVKQQLNATYLFVKSCCHRSTRLIRRELHGCAILRCIDERHFKPHLLLRTGRYTKAMVVVQMNESVKQQLNATYLFVKSCCHRSTRLIRRELHGWAILRWISTGHVKNRVSLNAIWCTEADWIFMDISQATLWEPIPLNFVISVENSPMYICMVILVHDGKTRHISESVSIC